MPRALPSAPHPESACASAPPPRRARRKEARPGELLDAALDLFVEKGFAATRVEAVAARAGVSKGTLFLYFPSKEALFMAVVRENLAGRFDGWNLEFDAFTGSTPDLLHHVLRLWWERVGATRMAGITKLMLSEGGNFPELAAFYRAEVLAPGHALLRRVIERGIEQREFKPVDVDQALAAIVSAMLYLQLSLHSGSLLMTPAHVLDPLSFLARQADLLLHGLCLPTELPA